MSFGLNNNRVGGSNSFLEAFEGFTGASQRFTGSGVTIDPAQANGPMVPELIPDRPGASEGLRGFFGGFTGETQRFIGVGEAVEPSEPVDNGSFGAIASYQVCACCARFHGPTSGIDGGGGPTFGLNADDRGVFGPNGKPSLSSTDAGAQITRTNQSWSSALGTAAVVTYAFRDSVTTMPTDTAGFSQFNATQIAATVLALSAWSDVANITFQRVQDAGIEFSNNATILLGNYSSGQDGAAAFAYLPGGTPGATGFSQVQGDVWINSSLSYNALPVQQGYGQLTLLHELGHAIGLSHPAAYNASSGGVITYSGSAIYYEDSLQYSVMSYFSERETGADFRTDGTGVRRYSAAPLLDDISAAQRLYGANMTTRTGDTVYGFNSNAGQLWYTAGNELSALVFCAWDAGGTDTFDFSGYLNNGQIIDLRQGCFSSVGGLVGNVSIALGAVIENAIGGSGSDTFRGNSANNRFTPNTGTDVVDGGLGTDTVVFSGARSAYTVTWNGQTGTVTGNGQNVTVTNVEFLQFTDQTIAAAPTGGVVVGGDITSETITGTALADVIGGLGGDDVINGLAGSDTLNGGSGNDTLNGGDDNDMLIGALGNDTLNGGAGIDTADYSGAGAAVTVNLTAGTASGGAGSDTLSLVENVTGTTFADTLTGDGAANVLRGGGGVDTLSGGGGADELYAGAPGLAGGAPDIIKGSDTTNGSIGTAVSLTGSFDLAENAAIANSTTIPHATVVATTHGNVEYYRVTVTAGETVNFDIDNATFDSTLRLFDNAGVELASNDDSASDGGESTDSALSHTFATAGTYYIQVGRWVSGSAPFVSGPPPANQTYTLHVSSPSQPTTPIVLLGSTLNGDAGADLLTGGTGADTLNGGADDDTLNGAGGNDTINGGDGTDTAVFTGNRSTYTITVSGGTTTVTGADGTDTVTNVERLQFADGLFDPAGNALTGGPINGTSNADTLNGTSGADVINGLDGDDVISGGTGNDTIDGGAGTDTAVFSGARSGYTVSTVGGTTTVTGPDGTDTLTTVERLQFSDLTLIVGAGGGQYFAGTGGNDTITGTAFADEILAAAGDDTLTGAGGNDTINGGDGTDTAAFSGARAGYTISTVGGVTTVTGPDGTDTLTTVERLQFADGLYGIDGNPIPITGTESANVLTGTGGADTISGLGGDDTITGGSGNDSIDGGDGNDTAVFAGSIGSYVITSQPGGGLLVSGADGVDTLTNVERVRFDEGTFILASGYRYFEGTNNADTIAGTSGSDEIRGLSGNDQISASGGDDYIYAGAGDDTIDGGGGLDTVFFSGSITSYIITSPEGGGLLVSGPDGVDTLVNVEHISFDDGRFIVASGFRYWEGSNNAETIIGSFRSDEIRALAGNDTLDGGDGDDYIYAGLGDDTINGGGGLDTVFFSGSITSYVITSPEGGGLLVSGPDGVDTLTNVEHISFDDGRFIVASGFRYWEGSNNAETIIGSFRSDEIRALGGNDLLSGGDGDDYIYAGTGNDTIDGGAGLDTVFFSGSITSYVITSPQGGGLLVSGPDGVDTLTNVEHISFDDGRFIVASGYRYWEGSNNAETIIGSVRSDEIRALGGNDLLSGGDGDDYIYAGTGNDTVDGGNGQDTVFFSGLRSAYTITLSGGVTTVVGPDGTDSLTNVERLQFDDGVYDISGSPLSALDIGAEKGGAETLPALSDSKFDGGPEVLPASFDDAEMAGVTAKDAGPQILPGESLDLAVVMGGPSTATGLFPLQGNTELTTFLFDSTPDDDYLVLPNGDVGPQVLPGSGDDFVLTAKFADLPDICPTPTGDFDGGSLTISEMELARELLMAAARDNPLHFQTSGDSLTLLDDWTVFTAPSRDVWG